MKKLFIMAAVMVAFNVNANVERANYRINTSIIVDHYCFVNNHFNPQACKDEVDRCMIHAYSIKPVFKLRESGKALYALEVCTGLTLVQR